jgi:hypothetical protein
MSDLPSWRTRKEMTQDELVAEATRRFGPDPEGWTFICPNCMDTTTAQDFRLAGADPNLLGQECIGRYHGALSGLATTDHGRSTAERGCDWAAYGLLAGPWLVTDPSGRVVPCFGLAEVVDDDCDIQSCDPGEC